MPVPFEIARRRDTESSNLTPLSSSGIGACKAVDTDLDVRPSPFIPPLLAASLTQSFKSLTAFVKGEGVPTSLPCPPLSTLYKLKTCWSPSSPLLSSFCPLPLLLLSSLLSTSFTFSLCPPPPPIVVLPPSLLIPPFLPPPPTSEWPLILAARGTFMMERLRRYRITLFSVTTPITMEAARRMKATTATAVKGVGTVPFGHFT
mmetsp:Transcript_29362/g.75735  ORF Transcript_29362/g.75735 Transcript_29362/m.75735 type:complete len:203 (-) Transcript_29362:1957-2565(-)